MNWSCRAVPEELLVSHHSEEITGIVDPSLTQAWAVKMSTGDVIDFSLPIMINTEK